MKLNKEKNPRKWIANELDRVEDEALSILHLRNYTPTKISGGWVFPDDQQSALDGDTRKNVAIARLILSSVPVVRQASKKTGPDWKSAQLLCFISSANPAPAAKAYLQSLSQSKRSAGRTKVKDPFAPMIKKFIALSPSGTVKELLGFIEKQPGVTKSSADKWTRYTESNGKIHKTSVARLGPRLTRSKQNKI